MDLIRIVVADDHPLYREGVIRTLAESDHFAIVGEAASGQEAEAVVARERPDGKDRAIPSQSGAKAGQSV